MVGSTRAVANAVCTMLAVASCVSQDADPDPAPLPVAVLDETAGVTTVVFGSADHHAELASIARGATPSTFAWIAVGVPLELRDPLMSPDGIAIELSSAAHAVTFTQVYRDVCDPAAADFSACFLYERYTAGETGLSGSLRLALHGGLAVGHFDVVWEGITDRFQGQPQWHRHESSTGFRATLVDER
jgi:hypothetical protein